MPEDPSPHISAEFAGVRPNLLAHRLSSARSDHCTKKAVLARRLCCFVPRVAMVQSAQSRKRNQPCVPGRLRLDWPLVRSVLRERIVNAILVMVRHVVANQPTEMFFV